MKRCVVAMAAFSMVVVPASAAQAKDVYMVRNVGSSDGTYWGDFYALDKYGKKVVGAVGAFSSEYTCIRGVVKNGKLRGTYYDNGMPAGTFTRKWVDGRVKGFMPATYDQMVTYLEGGDPRDFIANCRSTT